MDALSASLTQESDRPLDHTEDLNRYDREAEIDKYAVQRRE